MGLLQGSQNSIVKLDGKLIPISPETGYNNYNILSLEGQHKWVQISLNK